MKKPVLSTLAVVAMCGCMATFSIGCDEKSQDAMQENLTDAQGAVGDALASGADKAKEAFENLKAEYSPQIDAMSSQVASLKEKAATFKDTQLDGIIKDLETKLSDIKGQLSATFSADGAASLKDNLSGWMDEAKNLYEKATARVAELTRDGATGAMGGSVDIGG